MSAIFVRLVLQKHRLSASTERGSAEISPKELAKVVADWSIPSHFIQTVQHFFAVLGYFMVSSHWHYKDDRSMARGTLVIDIKGINLRDATLDTLSSKIRSDSGTPMELGTWAFFMAYPLVIMENPHVVWENPL